MALIDTVDPCVDWGAFQDLDGAADEDADFDGRGCAQVVDHDDNVLLWMQGQIVMPAFTFFANDGLDHGVHQLVGGFQRHLLDAWFTMNAQP
jgi:hypothetical protein